MWPIKCSTVKLSIDERSHHTCGKEAKNESLQYRDYGFTFNAFDVGQCLWRGQNGTRVSGWWNWGRIWHFGICVNVYLQKRKKNRAVNWQPDTLKVQKRKVILILILIPTETNIRHVFHNHLTVNNFTIKVKRETDSWFSLFFFPKMKKLC